MTPPVTPGLQKLGSLLRKAAVDAGFDLEPEADGVWWRLRSTAAPGVVWVRPLPPDQRAILALPLASQLSELDPALDSQSQNVNVGPFPAGAAGGVVCGSANLLHDALRRVWSLRVNAPVRLRARWDAEVTAQLAAVSPPAAAPVATEIVAAVRRRVGQDLFRDALLDHWEGRCAASGLAVRELLRASHAKPWAVASDYERLDVFNGLLLAVHLDGLFDQGFLTFDDKGRGLMSSQLDPDARAILGLSDAPPSLSRVHPAHLPYLAYHRAHVFRP